MGLATINIKFTADLRGFSTEMQNSMRRIGQFGQQMSALGKNMSLYVTGPLLAGGAAAIKFASDYQESVNKVDVAFGPASNSVKEFAKTTLESFGIAEGTALDLAATYGDMGTSMGLSTDKASKMATSLVGLAGDLASFKNISIDQANTALTSIFTGETESIKKLGIVMTEVNLIQYALSKGMTKQYKDMSQSEKVTLRYAYVMDAAKNAQGDFVRTGGGAANQMRIFQESLKQVAQQFGTVLLPAFTKAITYVNGLVKSFSGLSDGMKGTIVTVALVVASIGPLLTVVGTMLTLVPNVITKFNALKDAFIGLRAVIVANPYAALAVAIGLVALAVYGWYSNTEKLISGQKALNNAVELGNKNAATEVGALDKLYASATNVKLSINERKDAVKKLQDLYPAYFQNLDIENIKNGKAVGIYNELRDAIFNKARATAVDQELQNRANSRIEKELEIRNDIIETEAELNRLKKLGADIVVKGSASEKTLDVTLKKSDLIAAQTKLLEIQNKKLSDFNAKAKTEDEVLFRAKAEFSSKTGKLAENDAASANLVADALGGIGATVDKINPGTISFYEKQIEGLQKLQKEIPTTNSAWQAYADKITAIQNKIDALEGKGGVKLPKPEVADEDMSVPVLNLQELKDQLAFLEGKQGSFPRFSAEYESFVDGINGTKVQIQAIEGVEETVTGFNLVKTAVDDLAASQQRLAEVGEAVGVSVADSFSSLSGSLVASFGLAKSGFQGFIGGLLTTVTKLIAMMLASSISQSIAGATASGTATGPAAIFSTPAFIATAIGGVLAAFASIPKFEMGGVVGGSSFYGDKILARVNSGELMLNNKQQQRVYSAMNSANSAVNVMLGGGFKLEGSALKLLLERTDARDNRLR